ATAPPFNPVRFRNYFFRIDVTERPEFIVDEQEAEKSGWFRPEELMNHYDHGLLLAVPPVLRMLERLIREPDTAVIDDIDFTYNAETEVPCLELFRDFFQIPVRSNTLPPADRTNAFVVGGVLVDPSPADQAEMMRLDRVLDRFQLDRIMLTHHHFDHHQFAEILARKRGLPICLSRDSYRRIQDKHTGYFDGIEVQFLADGDVLTRWRGQNVFIHAVPGHDEGQLAIAPDSLAWFVVGDLIQGVGTVVISAPEGHMGRYFKTLERVIAMDPKIIIPSHGGAMGTTYRLKATLKHRQQREDQIYKLWREGRPLQGILEGVYVGLDPRLAPFAMANIQSHLAKLREEGRVT
ncbi:MAG: MBL fold metallo-hydrolase, partial [Acidobacteriota bacterium]|nr:MBL fold metallo-hydrolase [Acidobacteriota bacterium]